MNFLSSINYGKPPCGILSNVGFPDFWGAVLLLLEHGRGLKAYFLLGNTELVPRITEEGPLMLTQFANDEMYHKVYWAGLLAYAVMA